MSNVKVDTVKGDNSADLQVTMADQAAAAAKAAAADQPSAESLGVTPEQFAKFYNAETGYNWQGHSKELEFRAAQKGGAADDKKPEGDTADDDAAASAVSDAGLDWDSLEAQVVENGDIDEAAYKALAAIGVPENFVKDYIETVTRQAEAHVVAVLEAFGGDAGLNAVKEYAKENYSTAEMDEIDAKLSDPATYKLTVDQLLATAGVVKSTKGSPVQSPNAIGGGGDGVKGFENQAQMVAAMRDPRYKTDPAFRQEVTKKVAAATFDSNPRAHTGGL